jgi:hypothetical protein
MMILAFALKKFTWEITLTLFSKVISRGKIMTESELEIW